MDIDKENNSDSENVPDAREKVNLSLNGTQETERMDITDSTPTNENISESNEVISDISISTKQGDLFEGTKDANLAEKEVECSKKSLKVRTNSNQMDCMESGNISINNNNKREEDNESNKTEETTNISADSQPEKHNDSAENVLTTADSLMLSDSDNENISSLHKRKKGTKAIIDSDLEDDFEPPILKHCALKDSEIIPEEIARSPKKIKETAKNGTKKAKFSSLIDSESESEEIVDAVNEKSSKSEKADEKKKKISSLIDSDTESEGSDDDRKEENIRPRKAPPKRASAKVAMDQMTAIKSETQRLHRENYVSVPYHKPKQHTLHEFLTRKTITRPGAVKGSKLKMSKEELEEFAKHLEERAKEATEFFKSDSEGENKEDSEIVDDSEAKKEEQEKPTITEVIQEPPANEEGPQEEGFSLFEDTPSQSVQIPEENAPSTSNIKKILPDIDFCQSPSLKGDPNMLIDLETGDLISSKPTGVFNLLQRFLKSSAKRKLKAAENINILSVENGKVEMQKVSLLHQEESSGVDQKPGSAYFKLKNDLKSIIAKKRREELLKRVQGISAKKVETGTSCNDDDEEEEDEKFLEEKNINELDEEVTDIDENEEIIDNEAEEDISAEDESEADSEIDADDEGDIDDDDNDKDSISVEAEPKKSKSRIIAAFEDSDDEAESASKAIDDILTESLVLENEPENQLWANEEPKNSDDENELLELCSGRFDATQRLGLTQMTQGIRKLSNIPSSLLQKHEEKEERNDRNSLQKENGLRLESSDEEEGNIKPIKTAKKNLSNKQKKKLGFSDDEDDAENVELENIEDDNENNHDDDEDDNENEEEAVETYIDYDSEENEIEIQMNKNDRLAKAATFFEKEAELSESEWGSADEDEKDMDKYDIELGDEDQFDKQKLRTELEQIHLREMLDEDMRDVRKMKEMFLEDEDDAGAKRQRQFKWKHTENGFSLDNPNADNPTGDNPAGEEGEGENEEMWRKMRHERELLLKENQIANKTSDSSPVPRVAATSSVTITKRITVEKIQSSANVSNGGVDSPFLISKVVTSGVRGSFLIRDNNTLTKLSSITKADSDGATGVASGKSRNFVFATLSEEEMALKRKSSDLLTGDEDGSQAKKQKFGEVVRKKQLIDHLL